MEKQHRWLVVIIALAVIAIASLQSYLLYGEFKSKSNGLNKEIKTIFQNTIAAELKQGEDAFMDYFYDQLTDTSQIEFTVSFSEEDSKNVYSITDKGDESPYTSISFKKDTTGKNLPDSVKIKTGIDLIMEGQRSNLEQRVIYYYTEILGAKLHVFADSFQIDTVQLKNNLSKTLLSNGISTNFKLVSTEEKVIPDQTEYIVTDCIPTGLRLYAPYMHAVFENPFYDILNNVKLTLLSTIAIMLFTVTCFLLMFRIIIRQKKLSEMKDDFIANISHELQTPLSTVKAAIESMESFGVLDDKAKTLKYLSLSRMEIDRLSKLIDNILQTTIEEQTGLNGLFDTKDLIQIINDIKTKALLRNSESIELNFLHNEEICLIEIDELHIRNLINNLIDNAIKYSKSNVITIDIECKIAANEVILIFSDNGPGIKNEYQKHVFDKFYRIPSGDVHDVKGHGIGLHYVKSIVKMHRGSIDIKPFDGKGTTFQITLPVNQFEKEK